MKNWSEGTVRKLMMLLDVVSMSAAYMLSLVIRYRNGIPEWQTQIYLTVFLLHLLIYLFLFLWRRIRHAGQALANCDILDVIIQVTKDRGLQYVLLVLLLALSHNFQQISRLALLYMIVLDVVISCVLRLWLRGRLRSQREQIRPEEHYVIVTTKGEQQVAYARLQEILPENADIAGILYVDPDAGMAALRERLQDAAVPVSGYHHMYADTHIESGYYEIHCTVGEDASARRGNASQGELSELTHFPEAAHVFVYLSRLKDSEASEEIVRICRGQGIPVSVRVFLQGRELPGSMVASGGTYATVNFPMFARAGEVFGVRFDVSDVEKAAFEVLDAVTQGNEPADDAAADGMEQRVSASGAGAAKECPGQGMPGAGDGAVQGATGTGDGAAQAGAPGGEKLHGSAGTLSGEYICFSNVHTTVMANEDPAYREVLNGSAHTFADGTPIARQLRVKGFQTSERVAGPDFMDAVFRATMDGSVSHYFYGSTQETIDKLCRELPKRYPGIRIAGAVSPPFRPETEEEDAASVAAMNESGAAFIWIGLGAPKQEKWMAAHRGRVRGVMLGVGAGFNFYAGTVKRAPKWIQKIGMEWFYRLIQDPKRLANRYIVTNLKFLWYMLRG